MKAYTDLKQSKKLAEILPLDSADMWWLYVASQGKYIAMMYEEPDPHYLTRMESYGIKDAAIPCWSLAALLEQIPSDLGKTQLTIEKDDSERLKYWLNYHDRWEREDDIQTKYYDNLVDACYEIIVKLHEQKFI